MFTEPRYYLYRPLMMYITANTFNREGVNKQLEIMMQWKRKQSNIHQWLILFYFGRYGRQLLTCFNQIMTSLAKCNLHCIYWSIRITAAAATAIATTIVFQYVFHARGAGEPENCTKLHCLLSNGFYDWTSFLSPTTFQRAPSAFCVALAPVRLPCNLQGKTPSITEDRCNNEAGGFMPGEKRFKYDRTRTGALLKGRYMVTPARKEIWW